MKKFLVKYHLADTIEKIVEANSQEEAKLRIYSEAFDDDNFIIESVAIATEED